VRIIWVAHTGPGQAIVMATVTRMDSLLCGALAAILFRDVRALNALRRWLPWIASIPLISFVVCGLWLRLVHGAGGELLFVETIGFSLLALGFSSVVLYAAIMDGTGTLPQTLLRKRLLTDFGKYSYGIYVYHVPILGVCVFALHKGAFKSLVGDLWFGVLCVVLLIAVSFVVAKISYEYFERCFLELKRYFEARRAISPEMPCLESSA
jgi:peptidoglycan/LPS O-acetylase OafA/YrhL